MLLPCVAGIKQAATRPVGSMEDVKSLHGAPHNAIGEVIREPTHDEFPRPGDASHASHVGKSAKSKALRRIVSVTS